MLSEVHLLVLAAVGKLRRRGGYQTELAPEFKLAAGSFFYVVKVRQKPVLLGFRALRC